VIVGHPLVLRRALDLIEAPLEVVRIHRWEHAPDDSRTIGCFNPVGDEAVAVPPAALDARAGEAAYQYLVAAARAALDGRIDALVTAPLNKEALHRAGRKYPGHTEILAEVCGVAEFAMMLYLPPEADGLGTLHEPATLGAIGQCGLGVAHVTLHTSIRSVPDLLTAAAINEKIVLVAKFLGDMGCAAARIGVCALNPHAGEGGLFGDEETRVIGPAVQAARSRGIDVTGPIPADTLLRRAVSGEFDGVVAMYHDQGHIALKLVGFHRAVNVTLGLPIVRTSPSHGTAFDIAWQGQANAEGMIEAIQVASVLGSLAATRRLCTEERSAPKT
jgi:4-hydroxythreonine-4-phosphate dehydrogenase